MHDRIAVEMLGRCEQEIVMLRAQVAQLAPKAEAYDVISQILDMMPRRSQSMGEDLLWTIRKEKQKLIDALSKPENG